MCAPQSRPGIK